jgi:hypothetical protein
MVGRSAESVLVVGEFCFEVLDIARVGRILLDFVDDGYEVVERGNGLEWFGVVWPVVSSCGSEE